MIVRHDQRFRCIRARQPFEIQLHYHDTDEILVPSRYTGCEM